MIIFKVVNPRTTKKSSRGLKLVLYKAKNKGFTIFEALLVIVILSVLMSYVVPYVGDAITKHKHNQLTESIFIGLKVAQNEALSRGIPILVCPGEAIGDQYKCAYTVDWTRNLTLIKGKKMSDMIKEAPVKPEKPEPPKPIQEYPEPKPVDTKNNSVNLGDNKRILNNTNQGIEKWFQTDKKSDLDWLKKHILQVHVVGGYRDVFDMTHSMKDAFDWRDDNSNEYQTKDKKDVNGGKTVAEWEKDKAAWDEKERRRFDDETAIYEKKLKEYEELLDEWHRAVSDPTGGVFDYKGEALYKISNNQVDNRKFYVVNWNHKVLIFNPDGQVFYFDEGFKRLRPAGITKIKVDVIGFPKDVQLVCINGFGHIEIVKGKQNC